MLSPPAAQSVALVYVAFAASSTPSTAASASTRASASRPDTDAAADLCRNHSARALPTRTTGAELPRLSHVRSVVSFHFEYILRLQSPRSLPTQGYPNTTAFLQPTDAGIIAAYKKKQLRWVYDKLGEPVTINKDPYAIDQLRAMRWCNETWREATGKETIKNCFRHAVICYLGPKGKSDNGASCSYGTTST
ncbi:hypothetical protein ON010_g6208 [Phytophthora cinnamomi]|nr:hypothetical protein ON010_g6208 [Phytophthora cinnamomi]